MKSDKERAYIRNMETRSMGAWPAIQTIIDDGWILRFANGYSKRANSVNPIFPITDNYHDKIRRCEQLFSQQNIPCVFKLSEIVYPSDLDFQLKNLGYVKFDEVSVQEIKILNLLDFTSKCDLEYSKDLNEVWLDNYCSLNGVSTKNQAKLRRILTNIITPAFFVYLSHNGDCVACGLGVQDREYIGLFDIVVAEPYRKKGIGTELIQQLLKLGYQNGAKIAYLQVLVENSAALALYQKIGFTERYRYWYRKKLSSV